MSPSVFPTPAGPPGTTLVSPPAGIAPRRRPRPSTSTLFGARHSIESQGATSEAAAAPRELTNRPVGQLASWSCLLMAESFANQRVGRSASVVFRIEDLAWV